MHMSDDGRPVCRHWRHVRWIAGENHFRFIVVTNKHFHLYLSEISISFLSFQNFSYSTIAFATGNTSSIRHVGSLGSRRWWWWPAITPTSVTIWSLNPESWWSLPTALSSFCGSNLNLQWISKRDPQQSKHNPCKWSCRNHWLVTRDECSLLAFLKIC